MKLKIKTQVGDQEIEAELLAPGLAVHKLVRPDGVEEGLYTITHISSGYAVSSNLLQTEAEVIGQSLAAVMNWEITKEEMTEKLRADRALWEKIDKIRKGIP